MPLVCTCIECGTPLTTALVIHEGGVRHDEPGHSYAFGEKTLGRCAAGHGQLEIYSHDCWSYDEEWDLYWWYLLSDGEAAELVEIMRACPAPLDGRCTCALHDSLRDSSERLGGIRGVGPGAGQRAARVTLARAEGSPRLVLVQPVAVVGA